MHFVYLTIKSYFSLLDALMQKWTTHIEITTKKAIELAFKATMDKKGAEKGCDHCDLSFHMYIGSDILKIIFLSVLG